MPSLWNWQCIRSEILYFAAEETKSGQLCDAFDRSDVVVHGAHFLWMVGKMARVALRTRAATGNPFDAQTRFVPSNEMMQK